MARSDQGCGAARTGLALVALCALALWTCACERPPAEAPQARRTPTPLDTASTGTIAGTVRFVGAVPPAATPDTAGDPACTASLVLQEIAVDDGRLADVFVYLAQGLGDRVFAVPSDPVVIDQKGCLFRPRVAGAQVGQPIEFRNSDDTLHNVHGAPTRSPAWNFGLPVQGASRTIVITAPEVMVPVGCNVHSWMRTDIGVVDHPYWAVTGTDSGFVFHQVPPGTYVVAAWHRQLGVREATVTLAARGNVTIDLVFTGPGDASP